MSKDELSEERIAELERLHRQWIDGDTLNSHMARAELECVLLRAAPALIAAAREGGAREIEAVNARSDRDRLQARVAELEARLEKVGKLHDQWWNHGDELDALYAERLSTALTPPETAAGKEGKP